MCVRGCGGGVGAQDFPHTCPDYTYKVSSQRSSHKTRTSRLHLQGVPPKNAHPDFGFAQKSRTRRAWARPGLARPLKTPPCLSKTPQCSHGPLGAPKNPKTHHGGKGAHPPILGPMGPMWSLLGPYWDPVGPFVGPMSTAGMPKAVYACSGPGPPFPPAARDSNLGCVCVGVGVG